MSHIISGILGAAAMSVAFGAVQFASGSSLAGSPATIAATAQSDGVNRASKSDRAAVAPQAASTRTIALHLSGLDDTSVLVRIPAKPAVKASDSTPGQTPTQARRASNFACEPVVSVLTDVAKSLGPGRCVT